jgi:hypothetical protein
MANRSFQMKYETQAGLPTRGLTFAKLLDHLREAQECAALMAHLVKAEGTVADEALGNGWLMVQELLRRTSLKITEMAQGRLN